MKKVVLGNFADFTGKNLCESLFLMKVTCLRFERKLRHRCFSVKFAKALRTLFLQYTSGDCF